MKHLLSSYCPVPVSFSFFECRPGTGCRMGAIPWGRGRVDRKMDGEWIRSGKSQRQKQGWEKRKTTPGENTVEQELESGFRSHAKGQSIYSEGKKVVITGRKACGELPQELGAHNLISRSQREGMRTEDNWDGRAAAHSSFKNLLINILFVCFCFLTNCWDTLAKVYVSIAL